MKETDNIDTLQEFKELHKKHQQTVEQKYDSYYQNGKLIPKEENNRISVNVDATELDWMIKFYESPSKALEIAVLLLEKHNEDSLEKFRGYFTRDELLGFFDLLNGKRYVPREVFSTKALVKLIRDDHYFNKAFQRRGIDVKVVLAKVEALTPYDCLYLRKEFHALYVRLREDKRLKPHIQFEELVMRFEAQEEIEE